MSIQNNDKKITDAISKARTKRACENAIHIKDLIRRRIQVFCKRQLSWLDGCKSTLLTPFAESLKHSRGTRLHRLQLESLECRQLLTSDLISLAAFETPIGGNAGASFEASVSANPSPSDSPAFVEFPFGHLNFAIDNTGVGSASTVTLYLPDDTVVNTYYKYGPTPDNNSPHWYEFLYNGSTGAEIFAGPDADSDPEIIILHFIDGGRGDDDLTANGIVHDPGSPAFLPNQPPIPNAGGPYVVAEGSNLQLDASASFDPEDGTTLTYQWDLDYDGFVFNDDAHGVRPNASFPDNFLSRIIGLRVTNSKGLSSYAVSTVTVTNVAPQNVNAGLDQTVAEGSLVTLAGSFTDPGILDTHTQIWSVVASNGQVISAGNASRKSKNECGAGASRYGDTIEDHRRG